MAHNPKLDVLRLKLKPTTSRAVTFKSFFTDNYYIGEKIPKSENTIFNKYFQRFITKIDTEEFFTEKTLQKAITAYNTKGRNRTIAPHSGNFVLQGVIEGGRYGQTRNQASLRDKKGKRKLNVDDIILDTFYFFIYTPTNSDEGIAMIQSYTEDSIRDVFISFLKSFFSGNGYYGIVVEPFVPKAYVEKFKEGAQLKGFSFTQNMIFAEDLTTAGKKGEAQMFRIRIEASLPEGTDKSIDKITSKLKLLLKSKFQEKPLEEFKARVYVQNKSRKTGAYYDVEKDLDAIRPTIFLDDEINVNSDGMPDFAQLKDFCFNLLENVKKEISILNEIKER